MEKKYLAKFYEKRQKIKINLKNGKFYTGLIVSLDDKTLIFKDKFDNEIPISLETISYVDIIQRRRGRN